MMNGDKYQRDDSSGALLSTDKAALQHHKERKLRNAQIEQLEKEVAQVRQDMQEIKQLLLRNLDNVKE